MTRNKISWCVGPDGAPGFSWNPTVGCTPVSAGCRSCWTSRLASTRLAHLPEYQGLAKDGTWIKGARFIERRLGEPHLRSKPAGICVSLMGDLWHEDIPDAFIREVLRTMGACSWHRFYLLTKRPERQRVFIAGITGDGWPLQNLWLGVSIEDQATADERIPELLQTPAAVRFVSYEPALEHVKLRREWISGPGAIDGLILGCESGPGARSMPKDLGEDMINQLAAPLPCNVAFFFKQAMVDGRLVHEPLAYGRTWREMPKGTR